ncbi:MAG: 16S rRNA (uracil(1498)-N(3))-methyltransferase [Gemmatimonadetes bacterium]|nr:16S rRNA (uracil(1498)-N(3))-methyltransferase [Gemmatimonadota bacterium]
MSAPTFVVAEGFAAGDQVTLGEGDAHHIRVRRLDVGAAVALVDGNGLRGTGVLLRVAKRNATVMVETVATEPAPREVHLVVPVADKDRTLWLAEKAAELGATSWRPVMYRRSRGVASKGEGTTFAQKVTARMHAALEQSGSAWLPMRFPEATLERAIAAAPPGIRIVLDADGAALSDIALGGTAQADPVTFALGPEGGFDTDELEHLVAAGFIKARIGGSVLRFETAAVAALAFARAHDRPAQP